METHLHTSQYCAVPGNTILDAVATIMDTIAFSECTNIPICVLTLDFQHAFDKAPHDYLCTILRSDGLSAHFVTGIRNLYTGATSSVQINGRLHGPIPIHCGVRQGCPLSMVLYTLCLQPFLSMLEQSLPGVRIGRGNRPLSVVAYADDVTVFLTSVEDFRAVEDAIRLFEKASGAHLNPRKSQALAIGRWNASDKILGITYHAYVRILGVQFWSTINKSIKAMWTQLTGQLRSHAQFPTPRDFCLAHRTLYIHIYLLANI